MADLIQTEIVKPLKSFFSDSMMFLYKCEKPTLEEFSTVGVATAAGFLMVGFFGFIVKVLFIPMNNLLIGQ